MLNKSLKMEAHNKQKTESSKLVSLQGNSQTPSIERVLSNIYDYLHVDLEEKKEEISSLKKSISILEKEIKNYQHQLEASQASVYYEKSQQEGSKQLINKLLDDIKRYQNDIEWYKRTYEKRSIIGTLKEKITKSLNRK
jgi:peptidoglycan hydrolase CwlO-like protein